MSPFSEEQPVNQPVRGERERERKGERERASVREGEKKEFEVGKQQKRLLSKHALPVSSTNCLN